MFRFIGTFASLFAFGLLFHPGTTWAAPLSWKIVRATTSIDLSESHLQSLGLERVHVRETASPDAVGRPSRSPYAATFAAREVAVLPFETEDGAFLGFSAGEPSLVRFEGGFALTSVGAETAPLYIYDFDLEIDPSRGNEAIHMLVEGSASPFDVRITGFRFDAAGASLVVAGADLLVSDSLARSLGHPELRGDWIGSLDLRLDVAAREALGEPRGEARDLNRGERLAPIGPLDGRAILDVKLGELYGLDDMGRTGTYPNGILGLSAATTSCNVGTIDVPWLAPMQENHPTIGIALYRLLNDRLEMLGQAWLKHGYFALSSSQCTACQHPSDGTFLGVGCSDTYSIFDNGSQFNLGPRTEVNPHTGVWNCLGSYFDGTPIDCERDNFGTGLNGIQHRIEAREIDLEVPGATYFFEGCYFVRSDGNIGNNIGWRQVLPDHVFGNNWDFEDVGGGLTPTQGTVVETWGTHHDTKSVDTDDGLATLACKVTDLGGGQWHYEYALYNRTSDRGLRQFIVPVGNAAITNVGFRDADLNTTNEWSSSVAGGAVTWSTGTFGSSNANPLGAQMLFNFRFDANQAPVDGNTTAGVYKVGAATQVVLAGRLPESSAATGVEVVEAQRPVELALQTHPNPFTRTTQVAFTLPSAGHVDLQVLDVSGRVLRTLASGELPAGPGSAVWDGADERGQTVSGGIYFFRLLTAQGSRTIKGTLLK